MLLLARVVLGVALGGFWAMSAAMALRLVPMRLMPRAMSIILTGVSLATVCAAPVGAYVGDIWGWRTAFMIATVVGALALLVQVATIPKLPPMGVASFRTLLDVLERPSIRMALLVVLLVASGHFAGFTYVRPFLEKVPVLDIETISLVLLAYGIGGFFGNVPAASWPNATSRQAVALAPLLIAVAAALDVGLRRLAHDRRHRGLQSGALPSARCRSGCRAGWCGPRPIRPKAPAGSWLRRSRWRLRWALSSVACCRSCRCVPAPSPIAARRHCWRLSWCSCVGPKRAE
ncbi:MFS transporter [Mesorhizobium calcicola]|uniref:MFS transporter n=1 Tax=Mesorhizobium calcicola TaxID=1300310 RepID=A0ABW4WGA3_9HYPH